MKTTPDKYIWVKFQVEGFHAYPDAPEEVAFLRDRHRHMFHYTVYLEVFHDDREVEFILFKRELLSQFDNGSLEANNKSCEMLGDDLYKYISEHYPDRDVCIEVSEDGENGAMCVYNKE